MCSACWQRDPQRPFVRAATLADTLAEHAVRVPGWLDGLVAHLAARHCPSRAASMLTVLERLLLDSEPNRPEAILDRARQPGRSMGSLARALEGFFTTHGLALPTDQTERRASERRRRRVAAVPDPLRPAVEAYAQAQMRARERARRAGTRPRADHTVEMALQVLRDLAVFLVERGKRDWALVAVDDLEAFLVRAPANRARRLTVLRAFFAHARRQRIVLVDPTTSLTLARRAGFCGRVLDLDTAKALFRRWRDATLGDDPTVHPHESLVGLLGLLHATASHELAALTVDDIDHERRRVQLGRRPHSTPLDPHTWDALARTLRHRERLSTSNPHVLVTRGTKADHRPASTAYLHHVLDDAAITPRVLRSTRLVDLVAHLDPKLAAVALGMTPEATLIYLADAGGPVVSERRRRSPVVSS